MTRKSKKASSCWSDVEARIADVDRAGLLGPAVTGLRQLSEIGQRQPEALDRIGVLPRVGEHARQADGQPRIGLRAAAS
jgi:hypothetical protein